jgi:hypothetical protein
MLACRALSRIARAWQHVDMGDDWRLMGQGKYLTSATLVWKSYQEWSPTWEHDHCEFCFAKFVNRDDVPDTLRQGYAAQGTGPHRQNDYHWICANCARDFTQRFGWTVLGGPCPSE